MIRRVVSGMLVVAAAAALLVLATGARGDEAGKRYWVVFDNAFGLIEGGDVKVAGVRAGRVEAMELDRETFRARIGMRITEGGFDDLRTDAHCESRPQSLIGEYFIDCRPGTSPRRLPEGETIPVEQTSSTVPLDLINDIMRRPYRERFTILLSELGAGLAARGPDLNETIRRANPALRETDRVLRILAEQRRVIRDLYRDADTVVRELADGREDVGRFVEEARDTAATSASRAEGIRAQWRTFPRFLRELRPTLARLGESADAQLPALRNLNVAADDMRTFFATLEPFANASRPAIRTLAGAARRGRPAVEAATPNIAQLGEAVDALPQTARNLAITLEHLEDPRFAVERDERAGRPGGGYTGLEALLRYFYAQSQAINLFDSGNYTLKVNAFLDRECASYANAQNVRNQTQAQRRCRAWLGPNQPGVTSPDFTATNRGQRDAGRERGERGDDARREQLGERSAGERAPEAPARGERRGEAPAARRPRGPMGSVQEVREQLERALEDVLGSSAPQLPVTPPAPATPATPEVPGGAVGRDQRALLDYLLGD